MDTRIIGIDLAVTAAHKAIVLDAVSNRFVSPVLSFHTDPAELDQVLSAARAGASPDVRLIAVLEATGVAWYPVSVFLEQHGVEVYRVNGQQVAELRRLYQRHAKSDRIDVRVLPRLYLLCPERLHRLSLPSTDVMTLQRTWREVHRLTRLIAASKQRLLASDQLAWFGLADFLPPYGDAARWVREHWYDPWQVRAAGETVLRAAWQAVAPDPDADLDWIVTLVKKADQVIGVYGDPKRLDYAALQAGVQREQARLAAWEQQARFVRLKIMRPLYRRLHPDRYLETIPGVGQDSAAAYVAFIGDITRFPSLRSFRGWSGLIPFSRQSGQAQAGGLHITQAGPEPIKVTAVLDAQVARLWDPQIAQVYYTQMVIYGKHFLQAICTCATHLLDRVYMVLREQRPYELRDVDGSPVSAAQARAICQERYHVPDEIRRRNNHRVRRARAEQQTEQRTQRQRRDL